MGIHSDRRFLKVARKRLAHLFPEMPAQPGYFKRRRRLADAIEWLMSVFASQSPGYQDDLLLIDSTLVECARSRETVKRSALADAADYGYCASHSRYFWGFHHPLSEQAVRNRDERARKRACRRHGLRRDAGRCSLAPTLGGRRSPPLWPLCSFTDA